MRWQAAALGKNMVTARSFLEKRYREDLGLEDAIGMAVQILREGFDGTMTEYDLEVGVVDVESKQFRSFSPEEIKDHLDALV